jgi:hypothetical protein
MPVLGFRTLVRRTFECDVDRFRKLYGLALDRCLSRPQLGSAWFPWIQLLEHVAIEPLDAGDDDVDKRSASRLPIEHESNGIALIPPGGQQLPGMLATLI